jgi:hypothetical protein
MVCARAGARPNGVVGLSIAELLCYICHGGRKLKACPFA